MEYFFAKRSSENGSLNPSDFIDDHLYSFVLHDSFIVQVVTYIIICISIPLILVAIYLIYASTVRNDHVAPIYVINLLISDLIQLCCMIIWQAPLKLQDLWYILKIYFIAMLASVGFMVCLALERYAVIAHPLWYRFQRTIKMTVV
ncbi:G-protein coupled receptor 4-like isoform X2 [Notolabrus celidotus]|nr:G-protein coupled receptor 4-like isoform X2 [Notolabrus celidotus]